MPVVQFVWGQPKKREKYTGVKSSPRWRGKRGVFEDKTCIRAGTKHSWGREKLESRNFPRRVRSETRRKAHKAQRCGNPPRAPKRRTCWGEDPLEKPGVKRPRKKGSVLRKHLLAKEKRALNGE